MQYIALILSEAIEIYNLPIDITVTSKRATFVANKRLVAATAQLRLFLYINVIFVEKYEFKNVENIYFKVCKGDLTLDISKIWLFLDLFPYLLQV